MIIDLDETAIDNSAYEAGLIVNDTRFKAKTWDDWTKVEQAKAVPALSSSPTTPLRRV